MHKCHTVEEVLKVKNPHKIKCSIHSWPLDVNITLNNPAKYRKTYSNPQNEYKHTKYSCRSSDRWDSHRPQIHRKTFSSLNFSTCV